MKLRSTTLSSLAVKALLTVGLLAMALPAAAQTAATGTTSTAIALLDQIDWNEATVVEVQLSEHDYSPSDLVFERNKPYILRLNNIGAISHDLVGGSFFSAIAVKMAQSRSGRIVTPYLTSIYVRSKQQIELLFMPVQAGKFSFFCSIPGHREGGMEGDITVR